MSGLQSTSQASGYKLPPYLEAADTYYQGIFSTTYEALL